MQSPLSKFIDGYPSTKKVLKTRAVCFDEKNLYIRRAKNNDFLEIYENITE